MAKKTIGYVELEWACPNCHGKNKGTSKACQACGAPQPDNVQLEQRQGTDLVQDDQKIAQARKDADIHCPYCGTRNSGDAVLCVQCSGDLQGGVKRTSGRVVGAFEVQKGPVSPIKCPSCGTENPGTRQTCSACGANLKAGMVNDNGGAKPADGSKPGLQIKPWIWIPIVAFFVLCCGVVAALLLRTDAKTGVVQDVAWERTIAIQGLRDVTREDWLDELPQGVEPLSCTQELRRTSNDPVSNAKEVCGTPYSVDKGNGFAEVVQDCVYEVYDDYCKYTAQDWQNIDSVVAQGSDLNPYWPQVQMKADEREGEREEKYIAYFKTDSGLLEFSTESESLFVQLQPGTEWTLDINVFGAIVSVSR